MKINNLRVLLTLAGVGIVGATAIAPAAEAQRTCIIDNRNQVVCGRLYNPNNDNNFDSDDFNNGNNFGNNFGNNNFGRRREVERAVNTIYLEVLGRSSDANGLRTYSDRVLRDSWNYGRVRQELAQSPEARSAINRIYVEILRRNADPNGMNIYLRELQNGQSLDWVRQQLANSDEANRRRR
jgi:hypothetical protein